ncbi:uncharacterized protein LAESUDRAFT_399797 [Laetiporus sulphureus 93-53]|uniref:DNA polymerase n=1 Tax=Laetiporus sulphureus 93-53 TaxID=1314785 RepID=A0A165CFK9_9APHY|nr:uncharacterized protein LAESUDRAFT_399797 [Laetiporus sulphureus 93-53]KZT02722.1 hypothetical protein LAESUDRAFT_399797 [Laetiporus sulphureus 93-53]
MKDTTASLCVRVNQIDHTLAQAGPLDNTTLPRVPIIRIYGEASNGQKACIHVHQVYPYFFVEYPGKMNPNDVNHYISKLNYSLNHAIALSFKRDPRSPKSQFIRAVVLVKGVHFYGFHSSYSPFLKVHIADPAYKSRAVAILQSGTVMRTRFRVYESHLSYPLQFLCDFGLYGCGWMDLGEIWQRGREEETKSAHEGEGEGKPPVFRTSPHPRQSRMPLEVDVIAHQILNRRLLSARNIHHKLQTPAPPLPPEPLVLSVRELWEDERRRRIAKGLTPSPEIPKDPSADSRVTSREWVAEARWWEEVRRRIEREGEMEKTPRSDTGWERWVMTTFESIESLWENKWKMWKPSRPQDSESGEGAKTSAADNPYAPTQSSQSLSSQISKQADEHEIDVDETLLFSQAIDELYTEGWEQQPEGDAIDGGRAEEELAAESFPAENEIGHASDQKKRNSLLNGSSTPKRPNPFGEAWRKLTRADQSDAHRSTSVLSEAPTPTPPRREDVVEYWGDSLPTTPVKPRPQIRPIEEGSVLSPTRPARPTNLAKPTNPTKPSRSKGESSGISIDLHIASYNTIPLLSHMKQRIDVPSTMDAVSSESDALNLQNKKRRHSHTSDDEGAETHHPLKRRRKNHVDDVLSSSSATSLSLESSASLTRRSLQDTSSNRSPVPSLRRRRHNLYVYAYLPPSAAELSASVDDFAIPSKVYIDPHYSRASDAPERPREYAGLVFNLKGGKGLSVLEDWDSGSNGPSSASLVSSSPTLSNSSRIHGWEYASCPPSAKEVRQWLRDHPRTHNSAPTSVKKHSQIDGSTQANPYGLKGSPLKPAESAIRERQNMSLFSLEVFAPSREGRLPDPAEDEVLAIFYAYQDSADIADRGSAGFACETGMIVVEGDQVNPRRLQSVRMDAVNSELDLLNHLIDLVWALDPDIVVGWEVQSASWGYLSARASTYGLDIGEQISRAPGRHSGGSDQWGMRMTSTFQAVGRHVLNVWRIMRAEQNFTSHSFEHVVFQLLRRRTPRYSAKTLTEWYHSPHPYQTANLLRYFSIRAVTVLEILDVAEVVTKNAEFARIFGVDFFSVLSRGSQFKVESFMFRIAKPESFVLLSPSKQDVGKQNAAECMPLIMEPLSAFYNSPLVVLDFQSLYPSIMIAYNYCYSTCLGRVSDFKGQNKFGVTELHQPPGLLESLQDHIIVAPNGIMYVKPEVRKGLLGRMLTELLETRVMVKQAMKGVKDDKALRRVLDARQLGLKFIANVTYGYTSATYSGRMPAVEIADSIVQSGRETLEEAIRVIDSTKKWGAKVVYGDTDSLFVYLPGKTKEQAFRIGYEMAETITASNPVPVKLKFEKVYLPCVLMAKKRYVGFKFENPDDKEPVFDAKGIETVRRDGIPAQQKMVEACLKILFRTQDLSKVKDYCCNTWAKILEDRVSVQDFIFAKEVKMGTYSDKVPPPPGVTVAARRMVEDPADEPQYGERVPYIIVRGDPDSRVVDRAVAPEALLNDSQKHLDATYYISRVLIPPLERIFNLVGADVRSWYDEMPKTIRADHADSLLISPRKANKDSNGPGTLKIDYHFLSSNCIVCGALTPEGLCEDCRADPQPTITELLSRVRTTESRLWNVQTVCGSCCGTATAEPIKCESLDCPWLFERKKIEHRAEALVAIEDLVRQLEIGDDGFAGDDG